MEYNYESLAITMAEFDEDYQRIQYYILYGIDENIVISFLIKYITKLNREFWENIKDIDNIMYKYYYMKFILKDIKRKFYFKSKIFQDICFNLNNWINIINNKLRIEVKLEPVNYNKIKSDSVNYNKIKLEPDNNNKIKSDSVNYNKIKLEPDNNNKIKSEPVNYNKIKKFIEPINKQNNINSTIVKPISSINRLDVKRNYSYYDLPPVSCKPEIVLSTKYDPWF
jgi:hypothetical protein